MNVSFAPLKPDAAAYLTRLTGVDFTPINMAKWFCVTVRDDDGFISAVCACEPKTWFDWHFSAAISDPAAITRKLLRVIFTTLFSTAVRITAYVEPGNDRALRLMKRLGFVYEGFLRLGIEGNRDALVFGMLKSDCPWLVGPRRLPIPVASERVPVPW